MRLARLAVLGVAIAAGGAAAFLMRSGTKAPPAPAPVAAAKPQPSIDTVEVLVASSDVSMGQTLSAGQLRWQAWPAEAALKGFIRKTEAPNGLEEAVGSLARSAFLAGEPIRSDKLIKANGSGFMSAILPSGMRAVAISIDTKGASSAGGFILPNDRVDVIRTYKVASAEGAATTQSEIVLSNIRVLAIGQNVQEKNGEKVVTGETATLELTPAQAETVILAQKVGELSLALRSLADVNETGTPTREERSDDLTIIRYGVPHQAPKN